MKEVIHQHSLASNSGVNANITLYHIGKALEWAADESNPFILHKGKWVQACGNSSSWSTEELVKKYLDTL